MKKSVIKFLSILTVICLLSGITTTCFAVDFTDFDEVRDYKQQVIESLDYDSMDFSNYSWNYENVPDGENVIQWNSGDSNSIHNQIIDDAVDCSGVTMKASYISLMKYTCRKCDVDYGTNTDTPCGPFHGTKNYFGTLMYLWKFARKFASMASGANLNTFMNDSNTTILTEMANAGASVYTSSGTAKAQYQTIFDCTKSMVNDYKSGVCTGSGQTLKGRCKYIVFGIIAHLLGDVYAHRTVVPEASMYPFLYISLLMPRFMVSYNPSKHFDPSIFLNFQDKSALISGILNHNIGFSSLKYYYYLNDRTTPAPAPIPNNISTGYTDDVNFYSERRDDAEAATTFFFQNYLDGYSYYCILPVYYGLENINQYLSETGADYVFTPELT